MRKSIIALGLISFYSHAELSISGIIDLNIESISSEGKTIQRISGGGLSTNRIQFNWKETINENIKINAVYEAMYSPHTNDPVGTREGYLQLISQEWGTLSLGRQDTPSAAIYGYADPLFGNDYSVVNNVGVFYAPWREDKSLLYISPRKSGFQLRAMATSGNEDDNQDGRVYSIGIDYWNNSPWYFGAAVDRKYQVNIHDDEQMEHSNDIYLSTVYSFEKTDLMMIYHHYQGYYAYPPYVDFNSRGHDLQLGVRHNFKEKHNLGLSLIYKDDFKQDALSDAIGINLGYIYNLSDKADLYGIIGYVHHRQDSEVRYPISWNAGNPLSDENPGGIQLGMRYRF
ncbi:porin [Oceanisphaera sp. KMM 10153]|uniref:porin n=1 Tax=Oceanisphaera submarina TaxID=3390193 RepID=UPI00397551C1